MVGRTSALDPYGTVVKRLVLLSARSRLEPAHANRVVSPARREPGARATSAAWYFDKHGVRQLRAHFNPASKKKEATLSGPVPLCYSPS